MVKHQNAAKREVFKWLGVVLAVVLVTATAMTLQGCCSWCVKHCKSMPSECPPTVHTITVYPNDDGNPCYFRPEQSIKVRRGDKVCFVNNSKIDVKFTVKSSDVVFVEGNSFVVPAGCTVCRTVSREVNPPKHYGFDTSPDFHAFCPTSPGPGMDVDG